MPKITKYYRFNYIKIERARSAPRAPGLGSADLGEEVVDLGAQGVGLVAEFARGGEDPRGGGAGLARRLGDAGDIARNLLGAAGSFLGAAGDLAGGGALLLDRRGDRGRDLADLADRTVDPLDRLDGALGRRLDRGDLAGDLLGRLAGLVGQRLDLRGDDGESLAGFAGAGRLDRRVERQEVGLGGDILDELDDLADPGRRVGQRPHRRAAASGLVDGLAGDARRFFHLAADLGDRRGHLLGRGGDVLHVSQRGTGGARHQGGLAAGVLGRRRHVFRRAAHLARRRGERRQRLADGVVEGGDGVGDDPPALLLARPLRLARRRRAS